MPMPPKTDKKVPRPIVILSAFIAVLLTAVIIATMVFAWQNFAEQDRLIFREQMQEQERRAIQEQMEILQRAETQTEAEADAASE